MIFNRLRKAVFAPCFRQSDKISNTSYKIPFVHCKSVLCRRKKVRKLCCMKRTEITFSEAFERMKLLTNTDNTFTVAFFKYNRTTGEASDKLTIRSGCKLRAQLPKEQFTEDSENYFLFSDENGDPKTCFRMLLRFVGFPPDERELIKIKHFNRYEN